MKRVASKVTPTELEHQLRQLNLTQIDVSKALNVSQSQVSRVLSGQTSMGSRVAQDVCKYVYARAKKTGRELVRSSDELIDAVSAVWDGTPDHARALAAVIRSFALLTPSKTAARD